MTDYLTREMKTKMNARVEPVQQRNIAGRIAWQLFMDWKIEGQPLRQCETILVEDKRLVIPLRENELQKIFKAAGVEPLTASGN